MMRNKLEQAETAGIWHQEELGDVPVGSMPKTLTNSAYLPGKRVDDREHSKGNITAVAKPERPRLAA
jgi:hypothetical protein